jgi:hypothetical protein
MYIQIVISCATMNMTLCDYPFWADCTCQSDLKDEAVGETAKRLKMISTCGSNGFGELHTHIVVAHLSDSFPQQRRGHLHCFQASCAVKAPSFYHWCAQIGEKNIGFPTTSFSCRRGRIFTTHISWLGSQILSHIVFKRPINGVAAHKVNVGDAKHITRPN